MKSAVLTPASSPATTAEATASAPQGITALMPKQQMAGAAPGTREGWLRRLWYRLRMTVQEMNYATQRLYELQTGVERPGTPAEGAR